MCGRFYIDDEDEQYRQILSLLYQQNPNDAALLTMSKGEIFPTNAVPVVEANGPRLMGWGFSRFDGKGRVINARSETLAEKPMFRSALQSGRCLIPATGYFEWDRRADGKRKYRLRPAHGGMFYLAGLYRTEASAMLPLFVILTAPAAEEIRFLHERMPVIFCGDAGGGWLDGANDPARTIARAERRIAYELCG